MICASDMKWRGAAFTVYLAYRLTIHKTQTKVPQQSICKYWPQGKILKIFNCGQSSILYVLDPLYRSPFEWLSLYKKIPPLQAEIDEEKIAITAQPTFFVRWKSTPTYRKLTPLILNELVEKIVVHQAQGVGKGRTQQLEIHYNFVNTLDTP